MTIHAAGTLLLAETTGRVLLLERADGQGWDQPGGHVEDGEDAAEAACRELQEETGLAPVLLDCLFSFRVRRLPGAFYTTVMPRPPTRAELVYEVFVCTFREEFVPELSAEHNDFGWFDVSRLPETAHPGTAVAIRELRERGEKTQ